MNEMEQMMMQLWLASLKNKLKEGKVDEVIGELDIAVSRIEEDRAPAPDTPASED